MAVVTLLAALYLCMLGPAQPWLRVIDTRVQPRIVQIAASVAWTTLVGLALAGGECFSLFHLLAVNALATAAGFVITRRRPSRTREDAGSPAWPGLLIATAALLAYAPPMETHLAGSDSTTYLAAGIHLAQSGRLSIHDDLSEALPLPDLRLALFESATGQRLLPPFARIPGGLVLENWDRDVAWPAFFPAPMVWAAICSQVLGPRMAGAYSPLFAALALWTIWELARRHLSVSASVLATGLVAVNAANLWIARFPMSESLALFFLWGALLAHDTWETRGRPFDAALAGFLFGAAAVTRLDCAILVVAVWTLRIALGAWRAPATGFYAALAAMLAMLVAELALFGGAQSLPVQMAFWHLIHAMREAPTITLGSLAALATAGAVAMAWVPHRRLWRIFAALFFAAFTAAYFFSGTPPEVRQSLTWLKACLGWPTLALSLVGLWYFRSRFRSDPAKQFLILFVVTTVVIVGYNVHSVPVLPLGWRRFALVVVPGLLLFAAAAIDMVRPRSRWLAVGIGAVLAGSVALPARMLWSRELYRGTFAQLESLVAWLPPGGTLFIDAPLNAMLIGVPLWLDYHRNVVPVSTQTPLRCSEISMAAYALEQAGHGPIRLLARRGSQCGQILGVTPQRLGEFRIELELPGQHGERAPRQLDEFAEDLVLDELVTTAGRRRATKAMPAGK